jgi:hypothetical protein
MAVKLQNVKQPKVFLDITGSIKNGYRAWKNWSTDYEARIDKEIEEDFWTNEWQKEYSPIKAEKE